MEQCIFCKIAQKEAPATIVYEDEKFVVFPDIRPKASFHVLIIPKKHIETLDDVGVEDRELMGELLLVAQKVAREKNLPGYKLQMSVGKEGGQEIEHLHLHLLFDKNI